MRYQVLILCGDAVFGRMLCEEFEDRSLFVGLSEKQSEKDSADVAIVDLDSSEIPAEGSCDYLIGFSRLPAISAEADARKCSMILRRPFRMSLLREEVLSKIGTVRSVVIREEIEEKIPTLTVDGIRYGDLVAKFSPAEYRIVKKLAEADGNPVPRAELENVAEVTYSRELEVFVCSIRKKLQALGLRQALETVHGFGYRLILSQNR